MISLSRKSNLQEDKNINEKKEYLSEQKFSTNNTLSMDESLLLKKILEEYNDLFPEIMHLNNEEFLSSFKQYIQIYFASKNILFSTEILNKILSIILVEYYLPEKEKINNLIKSITRSKIFIDEENKQYTPHCFKTTRPAHICGERLYKLDNGKYFYCLKCRKIYDNKSVLLFCENCNKDYYTEIKDKNKVLNMNKIDYKLKPATWAKYHCNVSMNDTMKCPNCHNNFYLNMKKRLYCVKCNYDIDQFDIKWKCQICGEEFSSEAKEYNPLVFKSMKLAVKKTIFNGIEAKPPFVPCCILSNDQISKMKFTHKKECNGILYQGMLDNQKIVVCLKCSMLNFYNNHLWMCPLCKNKFKLVNNKNYYHSSKSGEIKEQEKNNLFKSEKFIKKNKNILKQYNESKPKTSKKKIQNFVKFADDALPKSYKTNEKKARDEEIQDYLPLKKYNSGVYPLKTQNNNFYKKEDIKESHTGENKYNISKYQSKNIDTDKINESYANSHIKKKSLYGLSKNIRDIYLKQNSNEDNFDNKLYRFAYSKERPKINISQKINELISKKEYIKQYLKNNEKNNENNNNSEYINKSNKLLRMISNNNEKGKNEGSEIIKIKQQYFSNKVNSKNMKSMNNISKNNLSNININLNVNVNINNTQKEHILKNMSSYKYKNSISTNFDQKKYVSYNKSKSNNLPMNSSKNIPSSSLSNFDIDDYIIVKQIGEGTFGKIYEVKDKYHRHFAMKKLICNSIKEMEILRKEYEILYHCEGLNINLVQIYGIETKKLDKITFVMYVLMELAKTDWEKEILQRKRINNYYSEKELISILKDLTRTLSHLQQNNISHRDIKPQNILLCDHGILKISDFGEAKENMDSDCTNTVKQTIRGTELYMSPVLFRSLKKKNKSKYIKHNTYKSDVFSLGYCLLLATTLNFDCLFSIRELDDMNLIINNIKAFVNNRYSNYFLKVLFIMLELEEQMRPDFIQLENIVKNL